MIDIFIASTALHLKIVNSINQQRKSILLIISNIDMKHYMHSYISNNRFLKIIIIHRRIINIQQLIAIKKKYNIFGNVYVGNVCWECWDFCITV